MTNELWMRYKLHTPLVESATRMNIIQCHLVGRRAVGAAVLSEQRPRKVKDEPTFENGRTPEDRPLDACPEAKAAFSIAQQHVPDPIRARRREGHSLRRLSSKLRAI